jgi:hypothetical protein
MVGHGSDAGGAAEEGFFAEEGGELGQSDWLFSGINDSFNAGFKTHRGMGSQAPHKRQRRFLDSTENAAVDAMGPGPT